MSVLSEILSWAKSLPKWQQYVIVHIINGTTFDSAKYNEVADYALDNSMLADNMLDGIVYHESESQEVRLKGISELYNINNLKDGCILDFRLDGLTVVYGQNGTGKSGYSRVIKKCCKSRDKDSEILTNIHKKSSERQSARINYTIDGVNDKYVWSKTSRPSVDLQLVHVFDRTSGEVFVSKDADIQYKPSGMDILDRLADVMLQVATILQARRENLQMNDLVPLFRTDYAGTKAAKLIEDFSIPNALAVYESLSALSRNEQIRLEELKQTIPLRESSSPTKERDKLSKRNTLLINVRNYFSSLLGVVSKSKIAELNRIIVSLLAAKKNAADVERIHFDSTHFLAGTGNEAWKTMWRAAEKFSKEFVYIGQNYPPEVEDSKCVLCQQPITNESNDNMKLFCTYVNDESQRILAECVRALQEVQNEISSTLKSPNDQNILLMSIEEDYSEVYESLTVSIKTLRTAIFAIVKSLEEAEMIRGEVASPPEHTQFLQDIDNLLEKNKVDLADPLNDEAYREAIDKDKEEYRDLCSRRLLKQH